jgi:uridine nucleosidase
LYAFAAPETIKVYCGAARPLLRPARHDPEIHGPDGLGGVEGLPSAESASVRERIESGPAIEAIAGAIRQTWDGGAGSKVTLVASGPLTNIALFVSVYTDLFEAIDQIVIMGGGIGVGNRSAVAGLSTHSAFAHLICLTDVHSQSLISYAIVGFSFLLPRLPHA